MDFLPTEATVKVIRTTVEVVDKDGGLNEEVVLCSHFVHGAAFGARPSLPGSCGREQATGSVILVDLGGRGGGP